MWEKTCILLFMITFSFLQFPHCSSAWVCLFEQRLGGQRKCSGWEPGWECRRASRCCQAGPIRDEYCDHVTSCPPITAHLGGRVVFDQLPAAAHLHLVVLHLARHRQLHRQRLWQRGKHVIDVNLAEKGKET